MFWVLGTVNDALSALRWRVIGTSFNWITNDGKKFTSGARTDSTPMQPSGTDIFDLVFNSLVSFILNIDSGHLSLLVRYSYEKGRTPT